MLYAVITFLLRSLESAFHYSRWACTDALARVEQRRDRLAFLGFGGKAWTLPILPVVTDADLLRGYATQRRAHARQIVTDADFLRGFPRSHYVDDQPF